MSEDRAIRIALPSDIAAELIAEGVAEEAIAVRSSPDVWQIVFDGTSLTAAVVGITTGAVELTRLARALVRRARRGPDTAADITVTADGTQTVIQLPPDTEAAVEIVVRYLQNPRGGGGA